MVSPNKELSTIKNILSHPTLYYYYGLCEYLEPSHPQHDNIDIYIQWIQSRHYDINDPDNNCPGGYYYKMKEVFKNDPSYKIKLAEIHRDNITKYLDAEIKINETSTKYIKEIKEIKEDKQNNLLDISDSDSSNSSSDNSNTTVPPPVVKKRIKTTHVVKKPNITTTKKKIVRKKFTKIQMKELADDLPNVNSEMIKKET